MAQTTSTYDNVQFSRTQGIFSSIALAGSVVIGLSLFVVGDLLIRQSGSETPLVYLVAALFFLPIVFSCIQRSSSTLAGATLYSAARASGSALRLFFTVWLMVGGYLSLGALLLYGAATRVQVGLERVLGLDVALESILFLVIAAVFAKELFAKGENWRSRTAIFWICIFFFLTASIWGLISQYQATATIPKTEPLQHWLLAVSILASFLWGIDIILSYRQQFRNPNRTVFWSLIVVFCGGCLFSALIAFLALQDPSMLMRNWMQVLSWNESRLELLLLIAGSLICLLGLFRIMTRITRLVGSMILDGALPAGRRASENDDTSIRYYLALFSALLAYLAASVSTSYLLLNSAFAALLCLIFYMIPLLKKDTSRKFEFSLPLHPLIPSVAIVISIFLMWLLPLQDLLVAGIWLLAGALLYLGARKRMLPAIQRESVLTEDGVRSEGANYRVLVCFDQEQINESLIRIGSAMAHAKSGEILVLRILETSEILPLALQRSQGEAEWIRIKEALKGMQLSGRPAVPVVRIAPDLYSGIKATSREFAVDFILVAWPDEPIERLRKTELQSLLQLSPKPVGILRGELSGNLEQLSVACGNGHHSILALQIGESISRDHPSFLEVMKCYTKSESEDVASNAVQSMIAKSGIGVSPQIVLRQENDIEEGILNQSAGRDLLILGASDDPISGRPLPDGRVMDIAYQRNAATLIVKAKETESSFILRRFLAQLTVRLASLTPKEKSEVLSQLKVGLQARADFYLMVALAAAIAITGLIMNDGSIVLGAMLVSPLMSPIVGIACGIALGNPDLIRRSSASTFKGMAVVLGVGVLMTFLLPDVEPTDQILSRTHPGIFDLLAALAAGAAGAYSLGKKSVAGALPGVAMALSLEPPLATAGFGISTSQFWIVGGALLLFLTNLAAIVLSGVLVYLLLGMRPPRKEGLFVVMKAIAAVILITAILVIPLGFGTYSAVMRGHLKYQVESEFRSEALRERFELLGLKILENENGFMIHPTILSMEEVTPEQIEKFRKVIETRVGTPVQIEATILQSKRIESPERD